MLLTRHKKTAPPILSWLAKPAVSLTQITLIFLGSLLIVIGTKVNIPIQPIPVTLQSFAVLFIAMTCGFRLSLLSVLIYLGAALIGLPVVNGDLKMNAGYLLGFLLAAGLTGFLAENGWSRRVFSAMTAALLGTIVILLCGWLVLSHFMDASTAFNVGVKPFLLGAALKVIFLALIVSNFWRFMEKQSTNS